jgi:hypothetical protein
MRTWPLEVPGTGEGDQRNDAAVVVAIEGRSPWQLGWARLRRDKAAMIALGIVVVIVLVAIFAPLIAALTGHGVNAEYPPPIGTTIDGLPKAPSSGFYSEPTISDVTCSSELPMGHRCHYSSAFLQRFSRCSSAHWSVSPQAISAAS